MQLSRKILVLSVGGILFTSTAMVGVGTWQADSFEQAARGAISSTVDGELDEVALSTYNLVRSQDEALQLKLDGDLKVARSRLDAQGPVSFGSPVDWKATDQVTKTARPVQLPQLLVGGQWLGQNRDPRMATPLVDEVKQLVGGAATVFQRINPQGDMLRVATNVTGADGNRAIGTYIPAAGPDGAANPVVSTLLSGNTFRGPAFVVDAWYAAAYEPLKDASGQVVGALFVGQKQQSVASLAKAVTDTRVGEHGFVSTVAADGSDRGTWFISPDRTADGTSGLQLRDARGSAYVEQIVDAAVRLKPGELATVAYTMNVDGRPSAFTARVAYYKPWDWAIVVNAVPAEFTATVTPQIESARRGMLQTLAIAGLLIALVGAALARQVSGRLAQALRGITEGLHALRNRDLTVQVPVRGHDEIAAMAEALNQASSAMNTALTAIDDSTSTLRDASLELSRVSAEVEAGAQRTALQTDEASVAAGAVTVNISSVAAGSQQMTASIREISQNATEAAQVADDAVHAAEATNTAMVQLGESSRKIGDVVKLISTIAAQTNLLALNATIEAARAGETGKGFAVVANEVKELAQETARATEEIGQRVQVIQGDTTLAVEAIDRISAVISRISDYQTSIAGAVEEQTATTNEISRSATQAAEGGHQITSNIGSVADTAATATAAAQDTRQAASDLAQVSDQLRELVGTFRR